MPNRERNTPPEALTGVLDRLCDELATLRQIVDELKDEVTWAVRNLPEFVQPAQARRITSMPVDPCVEDWPERINRFESSDLMTDPNRHDATSRRILVRADDFAQAMEGVEQLVYCCESPELSWIGEPESPSIECRKCGYVVMKAGSVANCLKCDEGGIEISPTELPSPPIDEQILLGDLTVGDLDRDNKDDPKSIEIEPYGPPQTPGEPHRRRASRPLAMRLIFQPHMTDLVRIFGYATLSQEKAKELVEPLIAKYGREKVSEAAAEITELASGVSGCVRLTEEARRLSLQILGRPPAATGSGSQS